MGKSKTLPTLYLFFALFLLDSAAAFLSRNQEPRAPLPTTLTRQQPSTLHSFWRQWIPETDFMDMLGDDVHQEARRELARARTSSVAPFLQTTLMAVMLGFLVAIPQAGMAVSGGGLDYAGTDISGLDFSNSNAYKGKDFTQVIAKGTKFSKSNLQGCRFYKAYLVSRQKIVENNVCDG
jgi:hypothetical protein